MKILVFGDSHSKFFGFTKPIQSNNQHYTNINIKNLLIRGSSIKGFGRRVSTLSSRKIFTQTISEFAPDYICFALGQVDVELGYFYTTIIKKEKITFRSYSSQLLEIYLTTLDEIKDEFDLQNDQIIVKGTNISVLNDRNKAIQYTKKIITENIKNPNEVKQYHQELINCFPSSFERRFNHLYFNLNLKNSCNNIGFKYFDINKKIVDDSGFVSDLFIPVPSDHHLTDSIYIRCLHLDSLLDCIHGNIVCQPTNLKMNFFPALLTHEDRLKELAQNGV